MQLFNCLNFSKLFKLVRQKYRDGFPDSKSKPNGEKNPTGMEVIRKSQELLRSLTFRVP